MKKQLFFGLISLSILFFSESVWTQNNLLWQHYSVLNPAATGINHQFELSTTGYLAGPRAWGSIMNADLRIKKMHGAIGVSNQNMTIRDFVTANTSRFNYSYHHQFNENSIWGIGVGLGTQNIQFHKTTLYPEGNIAYTGTIGAHYKWKQLQIGIANTLMTDPGFGKVQLSSLAIADFTWEINSAWKLNFSVMENLNNHRFNIGVRATVHDKLWFGINRENNSFGTQLGYNFSKNFSVGNAITIQNNNSNLFQNSRISNAMNLKFTIPNK